MSGKFNYGHWQYYSDTFDWNEEPRMPLAEKALSIDAFKRNGLTDTQANDLFDSGYFCYEDTEIIIDRYYGGALLSRDMVSRFGYDEIQNLFAKPCSQVWSKSASSLTEMYKIIDEAQQWATRPLLFRGQSQHYFIDRKINNPNFTIEGLGEISFLSSFWRKVLANNKNAYLDFHSLELLEWSKVFYSTFDIADIERRHQQALDNGEHMYSMQDMADSDDPVLSEFGHYRLDLVKGMNHYLADLLATMLQHYGLYSPVIDLTTSPDVALFFATHKYAVENGLSRYTFNGTNNGKAVLYLLRDGRGEFVPYKDDPFLKNLPPERPVRQHCVVSRSNAYCVNLPGLFLEGIINLDFTLNESESPKTQANLFPGEQDDKFLRALRRHLLNPEKVSFFG